MENCRYGVRCWLSIVRCLSYKLSLAHWLPHMKDTPEENASKKLVNAFTSNDALVLDFIKRIKPAARNQGITQRPAAFTASMCAMWCILQRTRKHLEAQAELFLQCPIGVGSL